MGNEIDRILNGVERDLKHPDVYPKDAATLIIIDRAHDEPKVLFGRRHAGHKFMPGKFVFPGGRTEPHDRRIAVARPLHPQVEGRLMLHCKRASPAKARGYALAAVRETAEETGLLLGQGDAQVRKTRNAAWGLFAKAGIIPDLGDLHFVARAITPPGRIRRFDTRFFVTDATAIAHRIEDVVGPETELVELVWMPIHTATTLDLPPITRVVLKELEKRTQAGFGHALPVPFYRWTEGRFQRFELP